MRQHSLPPMPPLDVAAVSTSTMFRAAATVQNVRIESITSFPTYRDAVKWGTKMQEMYIDAVIDIQPITVN